MTGTVYVREEPVGINIREVSAYVEDHDVFVGFLTVREHLIFQVRRITACTMIATL